MVSTPPQAIKQIRSSSEYEMNRPTVSIGVTTYNAEDNIRDALQSAFGQTVPIDQIIVVDDASTDSIMSILGGYAGWQQPRTLVLVH